MRISGNIGASPEVMVVRNSSLATPKDEPEVVFMPDINDASPEVTYVFNDNKAAPDGSHIRVLKGSDAEAAPYGSDSEAATHGSDTVRFSDKAEASREVACDIEAA